MPCLPFNSGLLTWGWGHVLVTHSDCTLQTELIFSAGHPSGNSPPAVEHLVYDVTVSIHKQQSTPKEAGAVALVYRPVAVSDCAECPPPDICNPAQHCISLHVCIQVVVFSQLANLHGNYDASHQEQHMISGNVCLMRPSQESLHPWSMFSAGLAASGVARIMHTRP